MTGPTAPLPTGAPSTVRDRHDAASGAGDEDLVGGAQLVAVQRAHGDRHVAARQQLGGRPARHALQHALARRDRTATRDGVDVEARPLEHVALGVDQHRRLAAAVVGLVEPADEIEPVVVLDGGVDRLGADALDRRDDEVQPRVAALRRQDPDERDREDGEAVLGGARVAVARDAARHQHLDERVAQARQRDAAVQGLGDGVAVEGDRVEEARDGALEAVEVLLQAEERPVPDVHHVVRRVAAQEAPVQDRDGRLGHRHVAAVDERRARSEAVAVAHAGTSSVRSSWLSSGRRASYQMR